MVTEKMTDNISSKLYKIESDMINGEMTVRRPQRGYSTVVRYCHSCTRVFRPEYQSTTCLYCPQVNLFVRFCSPEHRVSEYFSSLRRFGLWPTLDPFQNCSVSEITSRVSATRNYIQKHECQAGHRCPLKMHLEAFNNKCIRLHYDIPLLSMGR